MFSNDVCSVYAHYAEITRLEVLHKPSACSIRRFSKTLVSYRVPGLATCILRGKRVKDIFYYRRITLRKEMEVFNLHHEQYYVWKYTEQVTDVLIRLLGVA